MVCPTLALLPSSGSPQSMTGVGGPYGPVPTRNSDPSVRPEAGPGPQFQALFNGWKRLVLSNGSQKTRFQPTDLSTSPSRHCVWFRVYVCFLRLRAELHINVTAPGVRVRRREAFWKPQWWEYSSRRSAGWRRLTAVKTDLDQRRRSRRARSPRPSSGRQVVRGRHREHRCRDEAGHRHGEHHPQRQGVGAVAARRRA